MRKLYYLIILISFILVGCQQSNQSEIRIAIIEPIEHTSMDKIVEGFKTVFAQQFHQKFSIDIENAQGDLNLQRAIIQKLRDEHYSLIAPIGTDITQMTVSMIHDTPIVSLAANVSDKDRQSLSHCQIAVVHDEISLQKTLDFIHQIYPNIKNIVLVHSASEKVYAQVQSMIALGKKINIKITPRMISSLAELYTISQTFPAKTQAIFILKDSLVVSGIETLSNAAKQLHIPLITSDEGSVENGAGFALGVREQKIGEAGAELAVKILNGKAACQLPIFTMQNYTVFVNQNDLFNSKQTLINIQKIAKQLNYPVELVSQVKS